MPGPELPPAAPAAPPGRGFHPDRAAVAPEVLRAAAGPPSDPAALPDRLDLPLRQLFRTRHPAFALSGSADLLREAAIRNGVRRRVLVLVGGADGERFARAAEACGREVLRAHTPEGRPLEAEHLARFLDGPAVDAVALAHVETSTGTLAPLAELAPVVRAREGVLLLVDASGSLGGLPLECDAWGVDAAFADGHHALALPPGLVLGTASDRLLARAREIPDRGAHADFVRLAEASAARLAWEAPPSPLCGALALQLDRIEARGGLASRWRRHRELLELVEAWVAGRPAVGLVAPAGRRAATVSTVRLPSGASAPRVVAALALEGWSVAPGVGALAESAVRIGHMGEVTPSDLGALLEDLAVVL